MDKDTRDTIPYREKQRKIIYNEYTLKESNTYTLFIPITSILPHFVEIKGQQQNSETDLLTESLTQSI